MAKTNDALEKQTTQTERNPTSNIHPKLNFSNKTWSLLL